MSPKQKTPSIETLHVGVETITYNLTFAKRKSVGITVRPDLSVSVRAPQSISRQAVAEIVQKRAPWILRHLQEYAQRPAKKPLVSIMPGECYQFLGRQLPLRVESLANSTRKEEGVIYLDGHLQLWVKETTDHTRIAALLEKWSRGQAQSYFMQRMQELLPCFQELRHRSPQLKIRRMKARWGSCSVNGVITLNLRLIHLDSSLIDYVIMHELCHLIEHNHSKQFYGLLTRMMPDWRARRQHLNEMVMAG